MPNANAATAILGLEHIRKRIANKGAGMSLQIIQKVLISSSPILLGESDNSIGGTPIAIPAANIVR